MATSTAMGHSSPPQTFSETSRDRSSDDLSAIFPDRPIRPLPKRKLRERLSPEVAQSIKYPPAPASTGPLFYYPHNVVAEQDRSRGEQYRVDGQKLEEPERNYIPKNKGEQIESDEEAEFGPNRGRQVRHSPDPKGKAYRYVQKATTPYPASEPPLSAASSVDGYDSFENTNNKKKRKIPTMGDVSLNSTHLSSQLALLGLSQDDYAKHIAQSESTVAITGHGLSGPGRGRYARARSGRSPLRILPDANVRSPKPRQQWSSAQPTGIISAAMAHAEKLPATPRGQENVSLLQEAAQNQNPASSQFTFTCESQVSGAVPWPASYGESQKMGNNQSVASRQDVPGEGSPTHAGQANHRQGSDPAAPRPRRTPAQRQQRLDREYMAAARERREATAHQNYRNPPLAKDAWICEFCEYERIFGEPPVQLVRQYERKDRLKRKKEAEHRRLLEKVKSKGRKGRKSKSKAAQQPAVNAPVDNSYEAEFHNDDYYEDDYDDEDGHEHEHEHGHSHHPMPPPEMLDPSVGTPVPVASTRIPGVG